MKFFAINCVLSFSSLGVASPVEQQAQAACATCSQGCLRADTGDCFPNWSESKCEIYRGVSNSLPSRSRLSGFLIVNTARVAMVRIKHKRDPTWGPREYWPMPYSWHSTGAPYGRWILQYCRKWKYVLANFSWQKAYCMLLPRPSEAWLSFFITSEWGT